LLHLHGAWAIGGSICLLAGATGFAILVVGQLNAKRGAEPFRKLVIAKKRLDGALAMVRTCGPGLQRFLADPRGAR
jgi:hypothetical protein